MSLNPINWATTIYSWFSPAPKCTNNDFLCAWTEGKRHLPKNVLNWANWLASKSGIPPKLSVPVGTIVTTGLIGYSAYQLYKTLTFKEAWTYMEGAVRKIYGPAADYILGPLKKAINDAIEDYKRRRNEADPLPPDASHLEQAKRNQEARDKVLGELRKDFDEIMKRNRKDVEEMARRRSQSGVHTTRAASNSRAHPLTMGDAENSDLSNHLYNILFVQPKIAEGLKKAAAKL